ncbi:FxsA family protein [Pararhizobium sp. IMCC21322]|uniref:FxsA family protein n=1 Tax=Pararhizobium sp. IMCC21322 TaxID=3067903 RepID=UPI002741E28E|nr:FxsA family protein [Pararhizobium sp. IMCC21322]
MRFSLIPFVLLIVPLMEIAAFVLIGGQIGVWATLAMVVVTAIIGSFLLRWQGVSLLRRIQGEMAAKRLPAKDLVRGAMLVIAGILLLTPGFVTDTIGFLLFVPPIQDTVWNFLKSKVNLVGPGMPGGPNGATTPNAGGSSHSSQGQNRSAQNPSSSQSKTGQTVVDLDPDDYRDNNPESPWADGRNGDDKV